MEFKDWAPWAGIGVNLAWNLWNTLSASRQRRRAHKLSEFKTLKTAADLAVGKLRTQKAAVRAMQVSAAPDDEFKADLERINSEISGLYNDLVSALEALDSSEHSSTDTWASIAEMKWDEFLAAFDRLYAPKPHGGRSAALVQAIEKFDALLNHVSKNLEAELKEKAG
ncbi:hypothetical protein MOV66_31880 [Agrobacterium sp. SHOUNA12C]|nr:hypothetical protein [Agrobacterium sp. BETTINA12B]MCJ9761276.1 hypothetical protein [Agrobacterium sp. SHOUNA12C]